MLTEIWKAGKERHPLSFTITRALRVARVIRNSLDLP
jgi:hypothetical protein